MLPSKPWLLCRISGTKEVNRVRIWIQDWAQPNSWVGKNVSSFITALDQNDSPRFRAFFDYWTKLRGNRLIPQYQDFDPIDVPWALSRMFVSERSPDGAFTYRLAGQEVEDRYPIPLKGRSFLDIMRTDSANDIGARWNRVLDGPSVCFTHTAHRAQSDISIPGFRLLMPFADKADKAIYLMSYVEYRSGDDAYKDEMFQSAKSLEEYWIDAADPLLTPEI